MITGTVIASTPTTLGGKQYIDVTLRTEVPMKKRDQKGPLSPANANTLTGKSGAIEVADGR